MPTRPRRSSATASRSVRRLPPTSMIALTGASAVTAKSAAAATPSTAEAPLMSHADEASESGRRSTSVCRPTSRVRASKCSGSKRITRSPFKPDGRTSLTPRTEHANRSTLRANNRSLRSRGWAHLSRPAASGSTCQVVRRSPRRRTETGSPRSASCGRETTRRSRAARPRSRSTSAADAAEKSTRPRARSAETSIGSRFMRPKGRRFRRPRRPPGTEERRHVSAESHSQAGGGATPPPPPPSAAATARSPPPPWR